MGDFMLFNIISILIIVILIGMILIYKNQIKNIYKQIDFINENETNKIITQDINIKGITILVEGLNKLIFIHRGIINEYKIKDKSLKQSITNISHDIRTPLTSLNGYFQLLTESDSDEEKERYSTIIQTRINNLKNQLEDMFTLMKIQDSNYKNDPVDCNINKIIQENLFSYYEDFNLKEIEPKIIMDEEPIIIGSNPVALDRIVNNLINNSLIHGKDYIGIRLLKEKGLVNLTVENDVENPDEIDLENIFTRFYKVDKARTTSSTGLGLTIVKELVEAMNGKVLASINEDIFSIKISLHL